MCGWDHDIHGHTCTYTYIYCKREYQPTCIGICGECIGRKYLTCLFLFTYIYREREGEAFPRDFPHVQYIHVPYIGLVHTHSKTNRSHNYRNFPTHPILLDSSPFLCLQPCVCVCRAVQLYVQISIQNSNIVQSQYKIVYSSECASCT